MLSAASLRWMGRCGLLLAGLLPLPSWAINLYRCQGSQGEMVYTSRAQGYRGCQRLEAPGQHLKPRRPVNFDSVLAAAETRLDAIDSTVWSSADRLAAATPKADAGATRSSPIGNLPARPAAIAAAPPEPILRGAVYRVRRADGSLEYTNLAPATAGRGQVVRLFTYIVTCMACSLHSSINWQSVPLQLARYNAPIADASRQYGVDEALLRAVIHAESAFNAHAVSLKGAQGLMQLMPATAYQMGVADAFDADQNIHGGARYLAQLQQQFHGDVRLTAAAYNAGANAVLRYGGVPPYAETQVYVQRVELLFHRYRSGSPAPGLE